MWLVRWGCGMYPTGNVQRRDCPVERQQRANSAYQCTARYLRDQRVIQRGRAGARRSRMQLQLHHHLLGWIDPVGSAGLYRFPLTLLFWRDLCCSKPRSLEHFCYLLGRCGGAYGPSTPPQVGEQGAASPPPAPLPKKQVINRIWYDDRAMTAATGSRARPCRETCRRRCTEGCCGARPGA